MVCFLVASLNLLLLSPNPTGFFASSPTCFPLAKAAQFPSLRSTQISFPVRCSLTLSRSILSPPPTLSLFIFLYFTCVLFTVCLSLQYKLHEDKDFYQVCAWRQPPCLEQRLTQSSCSKHSMVKCFVIKPPLN